MSVVEAPAEQEILAEPFEVAELTREEILRRAAARIEKYGWRKGGLWGYDGTSCAVGAIWREAYPDQALPSQIAGPVYDDVGEILEGGDWGDGGLLYASGGDHGYIQAQALAQWNDALPSFDLRSHQNSTAHVVNVLRHMADGKSLTEAIKSATWGRQCQ